MSKLEKGRAVRRARVIQALFMQVALALMLVILAFVSRADRRDVTVLLALLLIPVGWAYVFWDAHAREERARSQGIWTKAWDAGLRKRTLTALGGFVALAVVLAVVAATAL